MRPSSRRSFLRQIAVCGGGLGLGQACVSPWSAALAAQAAANGGQKRCIVLWMPGGPSQLDTFDPKPGHANAGPVQAIETSVPGLQLSEYLPKLAQQAQHLTVVRSLSTKEGDHGRGTFLLRTGRLPGGPIAFPAVASALCKELQSADTSLPNYVSIAPYELFNRRAFSPGFLGPRYAPLTVGGAAQADAATAAASAAALRVADLAAAPGVTTEQSAARRRLWEFLQQELLAQRSVPAVLAQDTVYRRALSMMDGPAAEAFDLEQEPGAVRSAYGPGLFGQGCLLARRLIERGVPVVEVALGGNYEQTFAWDTHLNNFAAVEKLCGELDQGWSALLTELAERGLLESTTILWLGEFGRTPTINQQGGRDHFPNAWSCVLAGGGIRGGQAYGRTSDDGQEVVEHAVETPQLWATVCRALGVDPAQQNISEVGRPIAIAEGEPIADVLDA